MSKEAVRRIKACKKAGGTTLKLNNLKLKKLPPEVMELNQLTTLSLAGNQLSQLPQDFSKLSQLTTLYLDGNQLSQLPQGFSKLSQLTRLYLSRNQLSQLPQDFSKLSQLTTLSLYGNQLSQLPQDFCILEALKDLELADNPWNETFTSLVAQGKEELFTYLRGLLKDGEPHFEAKLLLVGEGNVGKSSLVACLRGDKFEEGRKTTHGIELGKLSLTHPNPEVDKPIQLNTWDFGGQDVYRITHQFFFTKRSLYLMVWKPRENEKQNNMEVWLKTIQLNVPDASVLIVATHCEERRPDLDLPYLKRAFPGMILGSFEVDSEDGTGIETLKKAIAEAAAELPHMGDLVSARWVKARHALEQCRQENPQIQTQGMVDLCRENELEEDEISVFAELLHDLGHIIHYAEEAGLSDRVVLQPEWLTKAISYVLEDRDTANACGVLQHSRLKHLWLDHGQEEREQYPEAFHPFFLRLMEKFDICYRIQDGKHSLVAQMVPHEPAAWSWTLPGNAPHLALTCNMDDEAPGLIPWFTVRNHRFSTQQHWRKGLFLEHQNHEALITLTDERQFAIEVRGDSPHHFMALLQDSLEFLIGQRWPGLQYDLQIPCPRIENSKPCKGFFILNTLKKKQKKGEKDLDCFRCSEPQDVIKLLTGFVHPAIHDHSLASLSAQIRVLSRTLLSESREGPTLFSIYPANPKMIDLVKLLRPGIMELKLTLWCEHPGHWHPLEDDGVFTFEQSKPWLKKAAPYIETAAKTLLMATNALVPGASLLLEPAAMATIQPHLKLMAGMSKTLLKGDFEAPQNEADITKDFDRSEGSALRMFHHLLHQLDPQRSWGHLRRVTNQAGDVLWVCPQHYPEYDPGLPDLS